MSEYHAIVRDALLLVERKVPLSVIRAWSAKQRAAAEAWAFATHLRASDNPVRVPAEPAHVRRFRREP